MEEIQLIVDLVLAVLAAFAGGAIAQRLGQPVLLGYLVAGVVIGRFAPWPSVQSIQVMAEIGVAFLMFSLGAEFSLSELRRLGRVATLGGTVQILFITAMGTLLAPMLGLSLVQGVFLGALLALSSTVVAVKLLVGFGEMHALHGQVALGILLVQDLAVVPMAVFLPTLASGGDALWGDLALTIVEAGGVVLGAYLLGARLVPWLFSRSAVTRSRELLLLGIVGLALGTALATRFAGLSLAFGAFLAGLVVGESDYRAYVVGEMLPLRDLFASLFFVSVGMLIDPATLVREAEMIAPLLGVAVLGKAAIVTTVVLILGMPGRVALTAGLSVAQLGEFSFVLARLGVDAGALPPDLFALILATALVSILLAPFLLRSAPGLLAALRRLPFIGQRFDEPAVAELAAESLRGHAVICGFGRIGRELADALENRGIRYLVVEYNPEVVRELQARAIPAIFGDAANPVVQQIARLDRARLLAVLIPDARSAELATRHARSLYPRLDIVARAENAEQVARLRRAGATETVQPEFEAGVEVIRHALRRYGIGGPELSHVSTGRRTAFYRRASGQ